VQPSAMTCKHCGQEYHPGKKCVEARMEKSGCLGKVPHESREAAMAQIRRMQSTNNRDRRAVGSIRPYQCSHCGKWHVGH
jgi:hypothetical protein